MNTFDELHGFTRSIGAIGYLYYSMRQMAPVIKEEPEEIVVITVDALFC